MATVKENLITAREQIAERLVELTASLNANVSDQGRSVQLQSLLDSYVKQMADLDVLIARADGPWIVTSYGRAV
jgi:hypothetical protein